MKLFGHEIRLRLSKKRDAERLAAIRALNTRWRYIPYGEEVQVRHANPESDLEVGMVGTVLTKEENNILRFANPVLDHEEPGILVYVRFPSKPDPVLFSLNTLAPVMNRR